MGQIKTYADLPKEVLLFSSDPDRVDEIEVFGKQQGLSVEASDTLVPLIDALFIGKVELTDLPQILTTAGVPKEQATKAAAEFLKIIVLPVADILNIDTSSVLTQWGVNPAEYTGSRKITTDSSARQEPLLKAGPGFSDPILQHRLELIAASYRDGVRTREQAVAVLMRPVKTGGLDMKEQEANDVLSLMAIEGKENKQDKEPKEDKGPKTKNEGGAKVDTLTEADEAEVKQIAQQKKAAMESPALITDTNAAVDQVVTALKLTFPTGELRTRFNHIIDARLRDVRNGFETRAKLEASVDAGGVGMHGAPLVAVMELVEEMDASHHRALAAELDKKKEQARKEKNEKTVKTVRAAIDAAKAPPPPRVAPVLSASSIPTTHGGRPKVEDIRFERKLAGPIEELRQLTLTDFRRLSSDPAMAAQKVRDKVELASQEGYEKRIAAIKAWRESDLSRHYLAYSRQALSEGKGILDVLAVRRAAGEDVPTEAEMNAIVSLNGSLRF